MNKIERGDHTHHQQCLAQSSTALSQHFVRVQGNDVAKTEDEGVDVFHVEVIRCDSVGDRILRKSLGLLHRVPACQGDIRPCGSKRTAKSTHGVINSGSSSIGS